MDQSGSYKKAEFAQTNIQKQAVENGSNDHVGINLNLVNPVLLRINADNQDKQKICIFWTILIVSILLIAILSSYAIPNEIVANDISKSSKQTNLFNCSNPNTLINSTISCNTSNSTLTYGQLITRWDQYNQFITVYLQIKPNDLRNRVSFHEDYTFQLYDADIVSGNSGNKSVMVRNKQVLSGKIKFDSDSAEKVYGEDRNTVVGYIHLFVVITKLTGKPLYIKTNFSSTANFTNIKLKLQSYAINKAYTHFTIILRYVFFAIAIIACFLYLKRYVLIPQEKKIIEQKFIFIASILLILFNDPFYIITVLKPNGASAFFSILFIMNLIVFLLLFWIVVLERIFLEDGVVDSQPVDKKKIAYAILVWAILIIINMVYAMHQIQQNPILQYKFSNQYRGALIFAGIVVACGIFYIFLTYIRILLGPQNKLWRSNIFMALSVIFITVIFILIISNSLAIYNYKGSSILFVYCFVNIYVYYLQFMFTITTEELGKLENPNQIDEMHFMEMASNGTIDIVDVNLTDYERKEKRGPVIEKEEDSQIYYNNRNPRSTNSPENNEPQNKEPYQNNKDEVQSFDFD